MRPIRPALILLLSLVFLSACGGPVRPTLVSGDVISTEHGVARVRDAMDGAQAHCASAGKGVEQTRMDCGEARCVSTFRCVSR